MEEKASDSNMQLDEAEEALSFCDLPIYCASSAAAAEWEHRLPNQDQSFSSSDDQDLFEFFSEEWSNSATYPVDQEIIFCGKLIPFKEPISKTTHKQEQKNGGCFRWNSKFLGRKKISALLPVSDQVGKSGEKCRFSVRRVSILAWPAKPRWQLLMFGLAGLPAEMEMSDIRSRQRRRSPGAMFRLSGGGREEEEEKVRRGKGLWGVIRSLLGCGGGRRRHYRPANAP